ncbi:hypothetical protein ANAPH1_00109 [Anaplasma phagocytophilum]|nr:hypothetical protein ANAPH1_00109 [Anaplasma phagocytophilum]
MVLANGISIPLSIIDVVRRRENLPSKKSFIILSNARGAVPPWATAILTSGTSFCSRVSTGSISAMRGHVKNTLPPLLTSLSMAVFIVFSLKCIIEISTVVLPIGGVRSMLRSFILESDICSVLGIGVAESDST